ncbi:hypothetical protein RU92_GL001792 [Lactococcus cremoris subsp. tructae]|uniref:Uncharacterized protein n=1 Tax=Lactococcus cremoris subsp. tructae TaxID=542833 RepID=A0A2A5SUA9_LACLC|nr:hypothetical protein RU92_GL001792 [Lactococcus cremoris subsp. tructae]
MIPLDEKYFKLVADKISNLSGCYYYIAQRVKFSKVKTQ